jgi:hypothetical protein
VSPNQRGALVCAIAGLALAATLCFRNPVETWWLPGCPFHMLTGWCCPGCGATRALHELVHGELLAALHANPLFVGLVPVAVVGWRWRHRPGVGWTLVTVVVVFGIIRNVPVEPFTLLKP